MPEERAEHLKEKLATVRAQMKKLEAIGRQLEVAPDQQISLTDPDARSMATSGHSTGMVGYNVQAAVDTKHHLIVTHEVGNEGHDRNQLSPMSQQTKEALGTKDLTVLADRGYFSGEEILKCDQAQIRALVPKPMTSNSTANGRFDKRDFIYEPKHDRYRCPAGEHATWRFSSTEKGMVIHKYWSSACTKCPIRSACTTDQYRRINRWEHEDVVERMHRRIPFLSRYSSPDQRPAQSSISIQSNTSTGSKCEVSTSIERSSIPTR